MKKRAVDELVESADDRSVLVKALHGLSSTAFADHMRSLRTPPREPPEQHSCRTPGCPNDPTFPGYLCDACEEEQERVWLRDEEECVCGHAGCPTCDAEWRWR